MHTILVAGAGKIGRVVAYRFASTKDYHVFLADKNLDTEGLLSIEKLKQLELVKLNFEDTETTLALIRKNNIEAIVSCLPYSHTLLIAKIAKKAAIHYFDLTEDVHMVDAINELVTNVDTAFVPQCGLAPGFVNIVAANLIQRFDHVESAELRCGALPQASNHALQYALTWSVDGLINEYINMCPALAHGKEISVPALSELENLEMDGRVYEAFHTSGGVGSLVQTYRNRMNTLNYKSIRYPGHCAKMIFLLNDLKLKDDRETLKKILLHAIPEIMDDVVIIYVVVNGHHNNHFASEIYAKKFYPTTFGKLACTAIQATTTSGACSVIDIVLKNPRNYRGLIKQESFRLDDILENRFGVYFKTGFSH